ncbi:MAG: bifunctional UDP-sugar hydrolase/5'-nucleotidase [Bacillota bacterium]
MRRTMAASLFLFMLVGLVLSGTTRASGEELLFTIIHTSDEHSQLVPHSPAHGSGGRGGFARLGGAVAQIRQEKSRGNEPVLLVSAGDFIGGTLFSWLALTGRAPELSLMLDMGYDVVNLGNHEFDYGTEELATYLKKAGYPQAARRTAIVASNLVPDPGHPLADVGLAETVLVSLENGLKVGFLGLLGQDAVRVTHHTDGVTFTDQQQAARRAVQRLQAEGADVVVLLSHMGLEEERALARAVPGIHLIVGGHCHTTLNAPVREGKTLIVQSGPHLEQVGVLELAFHPGTRALRLRNTGILVPLDARVKEDPVIATKVAQYAVEANAFLQRLTKGAYQDMRAIVAEVDFPVRDATRAESGLGNLVADALRWAVERCTGRPVDLAVQPNGVLRGTVYPFQGRVTLYDLVSPLSLGRGLDGQPGYSVVAFFLTGEEIRRALEISVLLSELLGDSYYLQVSGLSARYDPSRAVLFWVPVLNKPLPTTRAVLSAHWATGARLDRGDQRLYHVVADYYTTSFIPKVGEMLPKLAITPKDAQGNPIADLRNHIVRADGQELKVWKAVLDYVTAQPKGPGGYSRIAQAYAGPEGRLEVAATIPLLVWPLLGLGGVIGLVVSVTILRRRGRAARLAGGGGPGV